MLNNFCTSLDFTLNMLVYYGILDNGDAQCFALEASIMAGAYLFVPLTCCLALLNAYVVKAYIQNLKEQQDEAEVASEDEKLRAFDRTTWDSRTEAIKNIRRPQILFTDTFRWTLRRHDQGYSDSTWKNKSQTEAPQMFQIDTIPLAKTSCSDEEHGGAASSTMESSRSVESFEGNQVKEREAERRASHTS